MVPITNFTVSFKCMVKLKNSYIRKLEILHKNQDFRSQIAFQTLCDLHSNFYM